MAIDIKQTTNEIILMLKEMSRASDDASQVLDRFGDKLNQFGHGGQFIGSMRTVIETVDELTTALRLLGFSDQYLRKIRQEMINFAAEAGRISGVPASLAPMAGLGQQGGAPKGLLKQYLGPSRDYKSQAVAAGRDQAQLYATAARNKGPGANIEEIQRFAQILQQLPQLHQKEIDVLHAEAAAYNRVIDEQRRFIEMKNRIRAEVDAEQGLGVTQIGLAGAGGRQAPGKGSSDGALGVPLPLLEQEAQSVEKIVGALGGIKDFVPGGQAGLDNLTKKMHGLDIATARVTGAHEDLSTGVRTVNLRVQRAEGIYATATVRMDKFGNVLRNTSNRFRSFTSSIGNNIVKVIQWTVATGLVFGALQRVSETVKRLTEIEDKLADVQIALGKGAGSLNDIFKESAEIAELTSSSIMGVVESYALAYQAAGSVEEPTLRAATANQLLQESMVLAELSGLEQAKALDVLVGALRQTGMELTEGRELLDAWVKVSRESNVSIGTMAETYAIVGAQAKDLGLEFEELNALAATLAEATPLSATEVGNSIRGIMSGFQTAKAENVLNKFSLSARDASDELKNFWDLLNEISTLIAAGALSPAQVTEIANALGGGYKQGGKVSVILRGMERAQQLVNTQFDAGGEAADALEIKMATLESAITRLGNAFTQFSQTLGEEGGVLGTSKFIVEVLERLVTILDGLTGGLGKATPALLAFGAAMLALRSDQLQGLLGRPAPGYLTRIGGRFGPIPGQQLVPGQQQPLPGMAPPQSYNQVGGQIRGGIAGKAFGIDPLTALLTTGIVGATAIKAATGPEEEREERYSQAGFQLVGAIVGGLIGSATVIGAPIGAVVGASMAGAFADEIIDYERDIGGRIAEHFARGIEDDADDDADDADTDELKGLADRLPIAVRRYADVTSFFMRGLETLMPVRDTGFFEAPEVAVESEDISIGLLQGGIGSKFIQRLIPEASREEYYELIGRMMEEGIESGDIAGAYSKAVEAAIPQMEALATPLVSGFLDKTRKEFIMGDIGIKEMLDIEDAISAPQIADNIAQLRTAFDFAGIDISSEDLINQYLLLDDATRDLLEKAARRVTIAGDLMNHAIKTAGEGTPEAIAAINDYNQALKDLAITEDAVAQRALLTKTQEREAPIVALGALSDEQVAQVLQRATALRDKEAALWGEGSEEAAKLWVENMDDIVLERGEDMGREFWKRFMDMDPALVKQAISDLDLEDAVNTADIDFGFIDLRDKLGMDDLPALMDRYQKVVGAFQTNFPDYEIEETDFGVITKTGFSTLHADMTLFNLAMQDLIDVNEQQLEGVWNIPAGMTAMVAINSLYRDQADSGAGGLPTDIFDTQEPGVAEGDTVVENEYGTGVIYGDPRGRGGTEPGYAPGSPQQLREAELASLTAVISRLQEVLLGMPETRTSVQDEQYQDIRSELESAVSRWTDLQAQAGLPALGASGLPTVDTTQSAQAALIEGIQEAFTVQSKIELNANIRLVVDGRTLANVVKQYLFSDIEAAANRQIGGGGGYVIEGE